MFGNKIDIKIFDNKLNKLTPQIKLNYTKFKKEFFPNNAPKEYEQYFYENFNLNDNNLLFLISNNNMTIGALLIKFTDNLCYIEELEIASKYQKKGFAKQLLSTLILYLKQINIESITLNVEKKNKNAIEFYKYLGFKTIKTMKDNIEMAYLVNQDIEFKKAS